MVETNERELLERVRAAGQGHVLRFREQLSSGERGELDAQLARIDFAELARLDALRSKPAQAATGTLEPPPVIELPRSDADRAARKEAERRGLAALAAGRVACFLAAGGQGTRLGWDHPKGTFPVGPVTGKSLFQLFSEQIRALERRAKAELPWLVMTSSSNRAETEAYFEKNGFFGLERARVRFVQQGDLPALDFQGKLLLESKHSVAMSPDGHGGALRVLRESGALDDMRRRGIDFLFYFQVDNPLCRIADPVFLGFHEIEGADMSTKWVRKVDPSEKVGLLARRGGALTVVEYSEIDDGNRLARETSGALRFRCGNTAIHVFSRTFLERVSAPGFHLEPHLARKAVPFVDERGEVVKPPAPNAIKFETFIFDVLAAARKHVALEVAREDEFEPLKNAEGPYSPGTVRGAISTLHARWLEGAGVRVPRDASGKALGLYEVSPLTALSEEELATALGGRKPESVDGKLAV